MTHSYLWPRDGALVADALDLAGYGEVTRRFFFLCGELITREGYLLHKYNPDGSLGSSWHAWSTPDGRLELPIQEDETGLPIWALWQHYDRDRDIEFIRPLYRKLVRTGADFMATYREPRTKLPAPSFDLWEERRGIHAFTTAAVWAGLTGETSRSLRIPSSQTLPVARRDPRRRSGPSWDAERGHRANDQRLGRRDDRKTRRAYLLSGPSSSTSSRTRTHPSRCARARTAFGATRSAGSRATERYTSGLVDLERSRLLVVANALARRSPHRDPRRRDSAAAAPTRMGVRRALRPDSSPSSYTRTPASRFRFRRHMVACPSSSPCSTTPTLSFIRIAPRSGETAGD